MVIDDEKASRSNLRQLISMYCHDFMVVGEAENALQGLAQIKLLQPDIVLLDIEMPGGSGFELLDSLSTVPFALIFVTAYNQFAIKAFKYNALDYLLKPVDIDELNRALRKAEESRIGQTLQTGNFKGLIESFFNKKVNKLALHSQNETEFVELGSVLRMEAVGSYTRVFLSCGREILVSKNLKEFEFLLEEIGRAHV